MEEPPVFDGAFQLSATVLLPETLAWRLVGAPGVVTGLTATTEDCSGVPLDSVVIRK